ncbi:MAG: DUF1634 domain-containing protein [Candidatus Sulfotelmatobacter sp.]
MAQRRTTGHATTQGRMTQDRMTQDKDQKHRSEELNVYADVYKVLLAGMIVSTALFAAGIVRALLHPQFVPLTPEWIKQHYHWRVVVEGIRSFDATVIMMIATILLILTPITRVAVSIYAFAVDRDRQFVIVTLIVMAVIILTVVLGLFGLR